MMLTAVSYLWYWRVPQHAIKHQSLQKKQVQVGDEMTEHHGNKGQRFYLFKMCLFHHMALFLNLNPLGVPSPPLTSCSNALRMCLTMLRPHDTVGRRSSSSMSNCLIRLQFSGACLPRYELAICRGVLQEGSGGRRRCVGPKDMDLQVRRSSHLHALH